ncbi:branched-chain amino acid ABC transporter permease/ATP-binding protein [Streptomyces sp. H10-C2]|uniref:branched-chain amino acid ABC transporter permease/ATP-binding protein n=1 Tax=unclassified Streptomyces TaxID=2593676 RepID=UPI0024BA6FF7|nr:MULTISPECIES: branched-chain amino acid ABC transporter permease/ATP-binding protein [unclassified Streptomyces]MDJ0343157.1 branched-chain amino acid ABC transporter permease/ATP-binding protein [Streptomyces sp. PH10-H1]MDJ0371099.1 branched-chain amino acid ABC transporter permease/ATP-binding protein [Streptomyces sp. H10-C2]
MASLTYDLTLAGLAVGSAAALTGIGLVVTYRATGVFNLAHGAIAMVTAYVLRELVVVHGWPLAPAAAFSLLVVAPGIGLALDRAVFRPLAAREAGPAETLVATLGVFVLLVGAAYLAWGGDARGDAPVIVPEDPWAQLAAVAALAGAVGAVTRWSRFGTRLRAVVDDRRLATLGGIDADRIAAAGWAFGSFTAGLGGVLLAPYIRLDPYGLSLLVMETMAVAVAAGMRSLPVAIGVALAVGVGQSQLTRLHPRGSWQEPLLQAVGANLFVVALLMAALLMPAIGEASPGTAPAPPVTVRFRAPPWAWAVCGILFLLPLGLAGTDLTTSVQVPAMGLILLSLVVVTGLGGQISLGQAAYAGLGALFTALLAAGRFPAVPALPELPALALAVVLVAPLGLLTGAPAVRRRGLALALATFAVGVAVSRFVFAQPYATSGLELRRPAGFTADRAYYVLELGLLAASLAVVHLLRRGRTGRALASVRDHEAGAAAAGVPVPVLKLFTFVAGAGFAALGGGMLGMGVQSFDVQAFDPLRGLLWFAAVLVLGADSPLGALAAAALLVGLDAGTREGVAAAVVGVLAVLLGRTPGGLPAVLRLRYLPLVIRAAGFAAPPGGPPGPPDVRPSRRSVRRVAPRANATPGGVRLTARRIRLSYDGIAAVDGVDLVVPPGRVTALTGPNGAGKSTLFDCLCGTARPQGGRVLLGGRDITRLPPHRRARLGLARTFQQLAVFPGLSVAENIRIGAEQGAVRDPEAVERILRLLALGPVRDAPAAGLPTGTLRRVELGRALAGAPLVLLLDEPAAGLDSDEARTLGNVLRALAADGMALLLVEHDLELVGALADFVYVMTDGRITAAGPPAAVLPGTVPPAAALPAPRLPAETAADPPGPRGGRGPR